VRITNPANYARTVFIEQLQAAGIRVDAAVVEENPTHVLPQEGSYSPGNQIALLTGAKAIDNAKLVMKVSYNIGSDTSLILWGLTQNVNTMQDSLAVEQKNLARVYGIQPSEYKFVDGSGGGETSATNTAVLKLLQYMSKSSLYSRYFDTMPSLGVDGSLEITRDFEADASLKGATGQVHAKTGTYVTLDGSSLMLKGQALAGYVNTKGGKRLAFSLVVNNVPISNIDGVVQAFQDQASIAAMLWRDF
jgi:D-alanyl-D-alanine carboxypeptidase